MRSPDLTDFPMPIITRLAYMHNMASFFFFVSRLSFDMSLRNSNEDLAQINPLYPRTKLQQELKAFVPSIA